MNAVLESHGTVLVVDDDPAVLVLIQSILMSAGYRVLLAAERGDAVRLACQKHIHIDLVLLDVRVPGVSGTELADEILSIRAGIPVLWMSGFVDEEFIRIRLLDGDAGFLPKPLHLADLLLAVQQAISAVPGGGETLAYRPEKAITAGARA
jgi:DNA-binding NtrC family response regulator